MQIISFNSYKGGACRTTTCYNTLPFLAEKLGATAHQPILVFDVDLDSMGLTSLFWGAPNRSDPLKKYSARHLFVDDESGINRDIRSGGFDSVEDGAWYFKHFTPVGAHLGLKDDNSVLFCGADSNADTISDDQFQRQKDNPPLRALISALSAMDPSDRPKAVVFDCASGVQLSTLNVLSSIDSAVMCMRPTTQFRIGTRDYLLNKIPRRLAAYTAMKKRRIVLLPTSVSPIMVSEKDPNREQTMKTLTKLRGESFKDIQESIVEDIETENLRGSLGYTLVTDMADVQNDVMGIPEIQRFKWTEAELLYKITDSLSEQEQLLKSRYMMLAGLLAEDKNGK